MSPGGWPWLWSRDSAGRQAALLSFAWEMSASGWAPRFAGRPPVLLNTLPAACLAMSPAGPGIGRDDFPVRDSRPAAFRSSFVDRGRPHPSQGTAHDDWWAEQADMPAESKEIAVPGRKKRAARAVTRRSRLFAVHPMAIAFRIHFLAWRGSIVPNALDLAHVSIAGSACTTGDSSIGCRTGIT